MYRSLILRSTGDSLLETLDEVSTANSNVARQEKTHQLLKNTIVQFHLGPAAFPQVVVVVLQTLPVGSELLQAVGVDILDTAQSQHFPNHQSTSDKSVDVHTSRTTSDLTTLLQTFQFPASIRLALALHVIVIECPAPISNEISCARQRRRRSSDLFDLGDIGGHRGGVHQDTLVEAAFISILCWLCVVLRL